MRVAGAFFFVPIGDDLAHTLVRFIDLHFEFGGRNTTRAVTEYDHLLCAVGCGDAHTVLFADLKRGALNVGIRRFRLLCEHNGNVVVADNVLHVTRDAIGIENENARAAAEALIIADFIH